MGPVGATCVSQECGPMRRQLRRRWGLSAEEGLLARVEKFGIPGRKFRGQKPRAMTTQLVESF